MRTFVIGDTHFGHRALATRYGARPLDFEDRILRHWRNLVSEGDLVIHLGDVVVGRAPDWMATIAQLPGRKILVVGNHDTKPIHWYMSNGFDFCCQRFCWRSLGLRILFTHEPSAAGEFDLNIHGHLHLGRHRECHRDHRHLLFALEETAYQPRTLESLVRAWKKDSAATVAGWRPA